MPSGFGRATVRSYAEDVAAIRLNGLRPTTSAFAEIRAGIDKGPLIVRIIASPDREEPEEVPDSPTAICRNVGLVPRHFPLETALRTRVEAPTTCSAAKQADAVHAAPWLLLLGLRRPGGRATQGLEAAATSAISPSRARLRVARNAQCHEAARGSEGKVHTWVNAKAAGRSQIPEKQTIPFKLFGEIELEPT